MIKLNVLNKLYIFVAVCLFIAIVVKLCQYQSWKRAYYVATITAPRSYPVHVRSAYFILDGGETKQLAYSDVNDFNVDWGYGNFEQVSRSQRLPTKLIVEYSSYRNSIIYQDTIPLPAERIASIFKSSEQKQTQVKFEHYYGAHYGLEFLIGLANKGVVVVWLKGENYREVLLKHQIKHQLPLTAKDKAKDFEFLSEFPLDMIKSGVDEHANYADSIAIR